MTTRALPERLLRSTRARLERSDDEGGFLLVEVMIAITLITVIMAAVGVEYVNGMANTALQRARINAEQVASTAVTQVRALDPSDLLTGRTQTAVTTERNFLASIARGQNWVSSAAARLAFNDATTTAVPVPTAAVTKQPGAVAYSVYTYLECAADSPLVQNPVSASSSTSSQRNCAAASTVNYLRLVVVAVWNERGCPTTGCTFMTSSLIDSHANPTFDLNQPLPAAPVVNNPGDQSVAVADQVSLQLLPKDNTGVAPFTWTLASGTLPTGLAISPAGLISGTVGGSASAAKSVTVTITDAFLRQASATLSWTVLPQLVFTPVASQATTTAQAVSLTLGASGGAGSPYTYTDPQSTLPPGLTLASTGTITGTPTTPGTYSVTLTVADSSVTRTATATFTWTIAVPPLALSNPGTQTATVNRAIAGLQLSASGGKSPYTYSATGLPVGITMSASGNVTGTPTQLSSPTVTATATDSAGTTKSVTFTWNVVAAPTVTTPGTQNTTRGGTVSVQVSASCPNSPCTYSIANQPANIVIGPSSGIISGSPVAGSATSTTVHVSATDASGAVATSSNFTWNIYAGPTITTPGTQQTTKTGTASVAVTSACPNTPCSYALTGQPANLSINASTGLISGTIAANATSSASVKVTVTDASQVTATSSAFTWNVVDPPTFTSPGSQTSKTSTSVSVDLSGTASGGTGAYRYTAANLPSGLSINATTGVVSGTTSATVRKTSNVSLTITDASGVVATTPVFNWFVSDLTLAVPDYSLPNGTAISVSLTDYTTGGTSPFTYQVSNLPPGLAQSGTTVSGRLTTKGSYRVTIIVTDSIGASVTDLATITVT